MDGSRSFTVAEAASIMGCKKSTIYQLLADGWLGRPEGRPKDGGVRVSEKSLFQFMILDGLSQVPVRTLRELKNGRKYFDRFFSKIANAKHLYIDEGAGEADPAPYPLPQGEGQQKGDPQKHCRHHDFVEQYHF